MQKEKWHQIEDYNYLISNYGRIKIIEYPKKFPKKLRNDEHLVNVIQDNGNGYKQIRIKINGKRRMIGYVHRYVAKYFVPNPDNLSQVDHIDMDKSNNVYTNLEWVSHKENMCRAFTKKPEIGKHISNTLSKTIWVHKNDINHRIHINDEMKYLKDGWTRGRYMSVDLLTKMHTYKEHKPLSLEHRNKISISNSKPKEKQQWIDENGDIHYMNKGAVKRFHPDWKLYKI